VGVVEKASKIPSQLKKKHAKPHKTMPKKKRTVIVNRKSGHLLCFMAARILVHSRSIHQSVEQ
jgi:hypothetical protein